MSDVLNPVQKLPGIRRTVGVYGIVDPVEEAKRRRHEELYGKEILKGHAESHRRVRKKAK